MAYAASINLSIVFSSLILMVLVLSGIGAPMNAPLLGLNAQTCETSIIHNVGIPIIGILLGGQTNTCSDSVGHLTIFNEVNNSKCSSDCVMTANYIASVIGNGSKSLLLRISSAGANVALKPGNYTVVAPRISGFYGQILSPNCSGKISTGESITCTITNSYSNNIQTWVDKLNKIKIQFSYSPPYPFVGNLTQLSFQATNSNNDEPLQISHIRMTLVTNVTANFNTSNTINNKNDYVTFENISANQGSFSQNYSFMAEGTHQIILTIVAKNNEPLLASFKIPILLPE